MYYLKIKKQFTNLLAYLCLFIGYLYLIIVLILCTQDAFSLMSIV